MTPTTPGAGWERLADATRHRRHELRLPQELGDRGGPSELTTRKIERAETTAIRNKTKTQLEHALQWPHGHVDRLLADQAPPDTDDARALRVGRLVLELWRELDGRPA